MRHTNIITASMNIDIDLIDLWAVEQLKVTPPGRVKIFDCGEGKDPG
jgi:hypothetical protein